MATYDTFYFDSESFDAATCVYTNSTLTTVAAQGWYSSGTTTRYLTVAAGVGTLGPPLDCPSCFLPCDEEIANTSVISVAPATYEGTYTMEADIGTGIGAIIVRIRLKAGLAAGVIVKYGSTYTNRSNKFSGSDFTGLTPPATGFPFIGGNDGGYRGAINATPLLAIDKPLWVGSTAATCQNPGGACAAAVPQLPDNAPFVGVGAGPVSYNEPTYVWSPSPNQFTAGPNANIDVETQQVHLGAGSDDWIMCVIPKTTESPTTIEVQYQYYCCQGGASACVGDALVNVECPIQLTGFNTSYVQPSPQEAALAVIDNTPQEVIYNAPGSSGCVGGAPAFQFPYGIPNRYDFAYIDPNGVTRAASGWYKYLDANGSPKLFFVDSYGVITTTDYSFIPPSATCQDIVNIEGGDRGTYELTTEMQDAGGSAVAQGVQIVRVRTNGDSPPIGVKVEKIEGGEVESTYNMMSSTGQQYDSVVELSQTSFENNAELTTTNGGGYIGDNAGGENLESTEGGLYNDHCYFGHVTDKGDFPFVCGGESLSDGSSSECGGFDPTCSDGGGCSEGENCYGNVFLPPNGVHNLDNLAAGYQPPYESTPQGLVYTYPWSTWDWANGSGLYPVYTFVDGQGYTTTSSGYIEVQPNQVQLSNDTVSNGQSTKEAKPGWAMLVIPKQFALAETYIKVSIQSLVCGVNFSLYIECVAAMPSIACLRLYAGTTTNWATYCGALPALTDTVWFAHGAFGGEPVGDAVSGTGNCGKPCIPGAPNCGSLCGATALMPTNVPYAYDMAFKDQYALQKADCGIYMFLNPNTGNNSFFIVDDFGVITCIRDCTITGANACPGTWSSGQC